MKIVLVLLIFIFLISFSFGCIDINSASLEELDEIIYIGKVRAMAIIDARPFESVDDLVKVYGIGEKILEVIKGQGLACVGGVEEVDEKPEKNETVKEEPEEVVKVEEVIEEIKNEKITLSNNEKVIKLNSPESVDSQEVKDRVIYESKNEKIQKYGIYGFCLFLVFIIFILLLKK